MFSEAGFHDACMSTRMRRESQCSAQSPVNLEKFDTLHGLTIIES
jgi:hypothetical protein